MVRTYSAVARDGGSDDAWHLSDVEDKTVIVYGFEREQGEFGPYLEIEMALANDPDTHHVLFTSALVVSQVLEDEFAMSTEPLACRFVRSKTKAGKDVWLVKSPKADAE